MCQQVRPAFLQTVSPASSVSDWEAAPDDESEIVAELGLTRFYIAHITAIIILTISIAVSTALLTYLLMRKGTKFCSRDTCDRLTVYLSICDLCYSCCHLVDHIYILTTHQLPAHTFCALIGAAISEFYIAQVLVVTGIAVNAFLMVVKQWRIQLGWWDWRLLAIAFGVPASGIAIAAPFDIFGPGGQGVWCVIDVRAAGSFSTFVACCAAFIFINNTLMYILIWLKLRQVARAVGAPRKYDRVAKVEMVFVAAYILPTGTFVAYDMIEIWMTPPYALLLFTILVTNMTGLFNFIAYTWTRTRSRDTSRRVQPFVQPSPAKAPLAPIDKI